MTYGDGLLLIDSNHLFPGTPEVEARRMQPVQWRPQSWRRAEDPVIAEVVDRAREDVHRSVERIIDSLCTSLGLDPFETWRWPHNDEIDREHYRSVLEAKAEAMIAMQIIDPRDYVRVTTVPF